MKPRTKGRLRERDLCWIESVLLAPPAVAAPSVKQPSPLHRLRRRHADLTGYYLRAWARNWVAMNCQHCNLCSVTPVPSCSLHSLSATLRQPEPGPKNQWKLRYRRTLISKYKTWFSASISNLIIKVNFDIEALRYRLNRDFQGTKRHMSISHSNMTFNFLNHSRVYNKLESAKMESLDISLRLESSEWKIQPTFQLQK